MVVRRRSVLILAACALSTFLTSDCGKEPQTQQRQDTALSSAPAVNVPQTGKNWPVVVAFGDSLTAGVAGRSYPDDLQDLLDQNGYRYHVDNQGVSGDTSSDGLARIGNVIAERPSLVLLEFGGNDGLRGVPAESIRNNLEEMMERLKQARIPFVLLGITLPPNYGVDYVRSFTAIYPELARKYHVQFVPFLLIDVYQHAEMMQPDGIHPNGEGNKVVAQGVFKLIEPLLKHLKK